MKDRPDAFLIPLPPRWIARVEKPSDAKVPPVGSKPRPQTTPV
jgi:hypothetical protein